MFQTIFRISVLLLLASYSFAETSPPPLLQAPEKTQVKVITNPVIARTVKEETIPPNSFAIVFHKPTYILPVYFTGSPYNNIYQEAHASPNNETIKSVEMKFQLSFKVPVWRNIFNYPSTLYLAYTQRSYWQAYDHDPFFRETDYEPEFFLANEFNFHLVKDWTLNFINLGAVHQSNGYGGILERSWNRIYVNVIASNQNWMISLKPWAVIHDATYNRQNPDLERYLGHGDIVVAFKYRDHIFALEANNLIWSGGKRAGTTLTWSFPINAYLKGYVQGFTGYGQSLIEYNHHTNSVGVGIALSNWV